ncbi:PREDICTED: acyl-coenzyme A oxidase-like protein isoform X1 [Condylura cristata]|uniref:acyl-coenzyme A oxidase-like protein isoform X1 n=1 Tax=Condylura cristata TaxID=143302 RepID=UPI000643549F|nr:PREDICTED: acyl-coenzyme A oxidase-like protein isoform X1 [Condylura cristata]XP_012583102.1 PREDICTED: acyl-coenzyme A oxidase-like protein isoform X1 [Condylura cristata]
MESAPALGLGDTPLHRYLDGDFWSLKNELRRLLGGCPLFRHRYDLNLDEMRALTFQRVKFTMGLPLLKRAVQEQAEKTEHFVSRSLAIGEVLSTADMATGVKCGIIYWLFGGAVSNLGSPGHITKWLQPLQEQKFTGMFAMTERGHGSNVRGIQTEATFDLSAQEFVIDTPCANAEKMYIGNAMHGNYAAVFAQLITNGRSQGPHCFIVPVRDENGNLYPGVTAIDMMHKEGLHGVDNGILIFDKVRIPRENLLDKFGSVAPDGQYHSPIKNKSARFNAMLASLTPTRLAVTFQALGAMKLGLTIAIRYSHSRRQFGPKAKEEVKIIEHQTQTLRLMPHLATALALTFASRYAGALLDQDIFQGKELTNSRPLQALVAGLKAYSTWENLDCLQDCRECTGGMGYMMENRISGLKCDTDVFVTFEGDNVVMLQVVVRELLAQQTKQYQERPLFSLLWNWAESGGDKLRTSFLALNVDTVGNLAFLLKAVTFRERVLQRALVARIYYKVMTKKEDFFSAWNSCLHHIATLSLAHIHRVTLEQFSLAVRSCPDPEDQALLMKFCVLYGTKLVFQERAWYLEHRYLTPVDSMRIRSQLLDLCDSVKDDALRVISAFNIPHVFLHAPIAGIANSLAAWAFYPMPQQPAWRGTRSQQPKLGARL